MPEGPADDMTTEYEPEDLVQLRTRIYAAINSRTFAPFSVEQVNSLNYYQRSGKTPPFTCPRNRQEAHSDGAGILVARRSGWVCPDDDYEQTWAHTWMADGSWAYEGSEDRPSVEEKP